MSIFRITKKGWAGLGVLAITLFFAYSAQAQIPGHGMAPGGMKPRLHKPSHGMGPFDVQWLKENLSLSADQAKKFEKVRFDYRREMIKRKAELKLAQLDMWESIGGKDLNVSKAEKQVKKVEGVRSGIMIYRIKALQEVRSFLSAEQYEKFSRMGLGAMRGGYQERRYDRSRHSYRGGMPRMMPGMGMPGMGMPPGMPSHRIPGYEEEYED